MTQPERIDTILARVMAEHRKRLAALPPPPSPAAPSANVSDAS
jgi:hypothetical protein